ncbi:MAG: hypothetical protein HRU70_04705 [Phycisphaeraceae bacterium]|nr:MAG: hypothetical protein HRU70_04705 [Phycisphaeraceae bacterium]
MTRCRPTRPLMALALVPALCAGCSWDGAPAGTRPVESRPLTGINPFAPELMRIHPLSHVALAPDGKPEIICHVELRDRWGDTTKTTGDLTVRLFASPAGPQSGGEQELLRWTIDLSEDQTNAALFDPATRTYRLPLAGAPDWIAGLSPARPSGGGRITLQATLAPSPAGSARMLSDDHVIRR